MIIVANKKGSNPTRGKRVYFKRENSKELESIKFSLKEVEVLGESVVRTCHETNDKEVISIFKAKKGFSILESQEKTPLSGDGDVPKEDGGSDENLDREALLVKYEELFGNKAPGNIKTETLKAKIEEKLSEEK